MNKKTNPLEGGLKGGLFMAKCQLCGKSGLFLKLEANGLCKDCAYKQEELARKERRVAYIALQKKNAHDVLAAIPRCEIATSGTPVKTRAITALSDITYSNITSRSNMDKLGRFVVIDTETTGLSTAKCDVVEIAAIRYVDFKPIEVFQTFIKPKHPIPADATQINGITDEMVCDAPALYSVIPSLHSFLTGYSLVGHNLAFDLKFLYRGGLDILDEKRKFFDTMQIAKTCAKAPRVKFNKETGEYGRDYNEDYDVYDYKLDTLCEAYNIFRTDEHRALGDCYDTARLFYELCSEKKQ